MITRDEVPQSVEDREEEARHSAVEVWHTSETCTACKEAINQLVFTYGHPELTLRQAEDLAYQILTLIREPAHPH